MVPPRIMANFFCLWFFSLEYLDKEGGLVTRTAENDVSEVQPFLGLNPTQLNSSYSLLLESAGGFLPFSFASLL